MIPCVPIYKSDVQASFMLMLSENSSRNCKIFLEKKIIKVNMLAQ